MRISIAMLFLFLFIPQALGQPVVAEIFKTEAKIASLKVELRDLQLEEFVLSWPPANQQALDTVRKRVEAKREEIQKLRDHLNVLRWLLALDPPPLPVA